MERKKTESWSVQADLQTKERAKKILDVLKAPGDRTYKGAFIKMLDLIELDLKMSNRDKAITEAMQQLDNSLFDVRNNIKKIFEEQDLNIKELKMKLEEKDSENETLKKMEQEYLDQKKDLSIYKEGLDSRDLQIKKLEKEIKKLKEKIEGFQEKQGVQCRFDFN